MSFAGPSRYPRPVTRLCLALVLLAACDDTGLDPADEAPAVPSGTRCDPVADWPDAAAELALLAEINTLRAEGGRCGDLDFLPSAPLRLAPALRCATRLHSQDMHARQFLGQVDPDGLSTHARLAAVEYQAATFGENDGFSAFDPDRTRRIEAAAADIAASWADNPGTCWKLRARELEEIGIGAYAGIFAPKDAPPVQGYFWSAIFTAP